MAMCPDDPKGLSAQCDCAERHRMEREGLFMPIADRGGWIFTEAPRRRQSPGAIYFSVERDLECHDGEPFVWTCCPSCGNDLPLPPEVTWRTDGTGDP